LEKPGSLFESNLKFLSSRSPRVCLAELVSADPEKSPLKIERSPSGPRFRLVSDNGSETAFESARDPDGEAARQISAWEATLPGGRPEETIVTLGFPGVRHLKIIAGAARPGGLVAVLEPRPEILRTLLEHADLAPLSECKSDLIFIISPRTDGIGREFRLFLKGRGTIGVSVFQPPVRARAFPAETRELLEKIKSETALEMMDRATKTVLCAEWTRYSLQNIRSLLQNASLNSLKDRFSGATVVLAAAGPSLTAAAPHIKAVRDKILLISVGTALKALRARGITPDIVVSVDSDDAILKQFTDNAGESAFLFSSPISPPALFESFQGRCFMFLTSALPGFNKFLEGAGAAPDLLHAGGTVSLTAADAALYLGCREIIFCGLDLAFRDDGSTHAAGTVYQGQKYDTGALERVPGNSGKTVLTSAQFRNYILMMGAFINDAKRERSVRFVNSSAEGAAIDGAEFMPPERLETFAFGPLPGSPAETIRLSWRPPCGETAGRLLSRMDAAARALSGFSRRAGAARDICLRMAAGKAGPGDERALTALEAALKTESAASDLLSAGLQPVILEMRSRAAESADTAPAKFHLEAAEFYGKAKLVAETIEKLLEFSAGRL
jgi:hypothetical protein